jgi:hypothetical protein
VTYAGKLDEWGLEFLKDTLPLDPFMVIQPGFDPAKEHLYRQTHVWIGGVNTSTPAHFDLFHNFYVSIKVFKGFLPFTGFFAPTKRLDALAPHSDKAAWLSLLLGRSTSRAKSASCSSRPATGSTFISSPSYIQRGVRHRFVDDADTCYRLKCGRGASSMTFFFQVDLDGDASSQEQLFPHYRASQLQALEVTLEPGDGTYSLMFLFLKKDI